MQIYTNDLHIYTIFKSLSLFTTLQKEFIKKLHTFHFKSQNLERKLKVINNLKYH